MLPVLGFLADRYRLEREIGAGGMATVYLAEDLRHRRKIGIKILRPEVSAALGPDRFLAEIELTAGLQHPHILPLYDSGEAPAAAGGRLLYYVMPYVEGESLRQRLARDGALPVAAAVRLLRDVADALAHAHARGVVHRDIKPENVMVTDRHALVADFGIAKALAAASQVPSGGEETTALLTASGVVVGTPAYMSPEQATGDRTIDHRSDIYSFGVLAYELLTGQLPFTATSTPGLIAAHLTAPAPTVSSRRPEIPPALDALVARCLEKSPEHRWQSAVDLVARLESIAVPDAVLPSRRRWVTPVVAALAIVAIVAVIALWTRSAPAEPPLRVGFVRALTTAPGLELDPALSPDGRLLAYAAGPSGRTRIFVRQIAAGGRDVPLTPDDVPANQRWPQWSPDGQQILFQAGFTERYGRSAPPAERGTIYLVPALGGSPRALVEPSAEGDAFAPAWSPDGRRVVFVRDHALFTIEADGSHPPRRLAAAEDAYAPRWAPDGEYIAYSAGSPRFIFGTTHLANAAPAALRIVRVSDGTSTEVLPGDALNTAVVWSPDSRHLLFVSDREGRRDVYRVAVRSGRAAGMPQRVTTGIDAHTISLSSDGLRLVYSAYRPVAHLWSVPVPASGAVPAYSGTQLTFDKEAIEGIAISRDGRWIAFDSDRLGNFDVWKIPATGGQPVQLTSDPAGDHVQSWSPDGSELAFHSFRTGNRDVFTMRADGTAVRQVTSSPDLDANPVWGADPDRLVIQHASPETDTLFLWTRSHASAPWVKGPLLTPGGGADPAFAPDGRLVAYIWGGALRLVAPDGTGDRILVPAVDPSVRPEPTMPGWSPDSRTVFYMAYDDRRVGSLWSIPVEGGVPRLLVRFDDPNRPSLRRDFATDGARLYYAVAEPASDIYLVELSR